ncbi:MAG: hypothetical protein JO356_17935 [Acidobacteria bacterium]|nr:hypothetical protein [Acidobacteriota bacterium]
MRLLGVYCVLVMSSFGATLQNQTSDALAISLAQQAITALTGGATVNDVTLNADVISILGSDKDTGTAIFRAKGPSKSRVDIHLSGGTRTDARTLTNGVPTGAWQKNGGKAFPHAQHNTWTDAVWFFPAFSSLSQTASPNFMFKYVGQEQHAGLSTQHLQVYQTLPSASATLQRISTVDLYLDPVSFLPSATSFSVHADNDVNTSISNEIRYSNYQPVSGVLVPFHFQQIFNGGVVLDVTVTKASFNAGLPDNLFVLP